MPDPFSTLPSPLPLIVLESIEDLSTLHHLLQASPDASFIFRKYYCAITEAIFSNFVPKLQELLRTIVAIRSGLCTSDVFNSPKALGNFLEPRILKSSFDSKPFFSASAKPLRNTSASLAAVRSLAKSANHVHSLSRSFFEVHLERINNIKPSYLLDQSYHYSRKSKLHPPEGRRYEPVKCGNPSWIEEQRVYRALWRLVLYFDLVSISKPSQGDINEVWELLRSEGPHGAWSRLPRWELLEMDCVYEFLVESSSVKSSSSDHSSHLSQLPASELKSITVPQPTPIQNDTLRKWHQSILDLNHRNDAASFFNSAQIIWHSPLYRFSIDPFLRLGFVIWDLDKMGRLGLADLSPVHLPPWDSEVYWVGPFKRKTLGDDVWFRWKSLVGEDFNVPGAQ
ncbi:MAG: hypothetical protein Q9161_006460 [Pseudevernia consocians]